MNGTPPTCPKCGEQAKLVCHGKRHAVYPSGCLMIVGLPIAMLHQGSCPTDYGCQSCGASFGVRSNWAKICLGIIVLLLLWILVATTLMILYARSR